MTRDETNRRRFLTAAASAGTVSIAGCLGDNEDGSPAGTDTEAGTNAANGPEAETDTPTSDNEGETDGDASTDSETATASATPDSVDEYLADTGNYDGTVEDYTDDDDIDVMIRE